MRGVTVMSTLNYTLHGRGAKDGALHGADVRDAPEAARVNS